MYCDLLRTCISCTYHMPQQQWQVYMQSAVLQVPSMTSCLDKLSPWHVPSRGSRKRAEVRIKCTKMHHSTSQDKLYTAIVDPEHFRAHSLLSRRKRVRPSVSLISVTGCGVQHLSQGCTQVAFSSVALPVRCPTPLTTFNLLPGRPDTMIAPTKNCSAHTASNATTNR